MFVHQLTSHFKPFKDFKHILWCLFFAVQKHNTHAVTVTTIEDVQVITGTQSLSRRERDVQILKEIKTTFVNTSKKNVLPGNQPTTPCVHFVIGASFLRGLFWWGLHQYDMFVPNHKEISSNRRSWDRTGESNVWLCGGEDVFV
jgi:hypothetical protein